MNYFIVYLFAYLFVRFLLLFFSYLLIYLFIYLLICVITTRKTRQDFCAKGKNTYMFYPTNCFLSGSTLQLVMNVFLTIILIMLLLLLLGLNLMPFLSRIRVLPSLNKLVSYFLYSLLY